MKLIYENDIPEWPIRNETEKFVTRWNHERTGRWKPNGITDNREEWREENRKPMNILARAFIKSGCDPEDINC